MTKEQLKKYLDDTIDNIRTMYVRTQETIQEIQKQSNSEWTKVYSIPVHMTPEQQERMKELGRDAANKAMQEYHEAIDKMIQEAMDTIAKVKKAAIQDLTAAEPLPTDEQLRKADFIKKEYGADKAAVSIDRVKQFEADMNYHVEFETVKAYPYYLAAKDILGKIGGNADVLNDVYNKLFPELATKQAVVADIDKLENCFRAAVICHKFDTIASPTEVDQLEIIRMKNELQQLGEIANLNQRVIRYT